MQILYGNQFKIIINVNNSVSKKKAIYSRKIALIYSEFNPWYFFTLKRQNNFEANSISFVFVAIIHEPTAVISDCTDVDPNNCSGICFCHHETTPQPTTY